MPRSAKKKSTARVQCPQCGTRLTRKTDLPRHLKKHDPNAKRYKCQRPGCSFEAFERKNFIIHSFKHTGAKPFRCGFCPFVSQDPSLIFRHRAKEHKYVKKRTPRERVENIQMDVVWSEIEDPSWNKVIVPEIEQYMDMVDTEYSAENATDIVKLKHKSPPTHASSAPPNDESTEGRPATKYGIESTSPPPALNQSLPAQKIARDVYCDERDLASTGVVKDLEEPDMDNIDATDTRVSINCSSSPTQCPADAEDTQSTPIAGKPRLPSLVPATSTFIYCDICCVYYPATSCCDDRNSPRGRTPPIFPTPPLSTCGSTVIRSPTPEYHISRGSSAYNSATLGTPRSTYNEGRYTSASPYIYVPSKIDSTGKDRYRNNFSGGNTTSTSYAARAKSDYGYTSRADTPDARSTHSDRSESPYITRNNTVRRINDAESTTSCSPLISDARRASYVPQTDLKPIWSSAPYCEDDFEDWDDDDEGYDEDAKDDGDYIYNEADECGNGDDEY